MSFNLRALSADDLRWESRDRCHFLVGRGSYHRHEQVLPAPLYAHDLALVAEVLAICEARAPLAGARGEISVLDREFMDGYNGRAGPDQIYTRDDGSEWQIDLGPCACGKPECKDRRTAYGQALTISLSGKVVPPMPQWTRYLVAHEYGHCAWYHVCRLRWGENLYSKYEAEYMAVRGYPEWKNGPRWHQLATEVIANDFRILVARQATDFWPHDVPPPAEGSAIHEWWLCAGEISSAGHPGDLA